MAVGASVLLVVARGDAERNKAAAEPASNKAENEAKDPGKGALLLIHVSHAGVAAVLALDRHWMVWPVARWVGTTVRALIDHDNLLACHGLLHHGLTWGRGHHYRLARCHCHRLLTGSILRLSHGLRGVLGRLLVNQRLLLGGDLTHSCIAVNVFSVHLACTSCFNLKYLFIYNS